MRIIALIFLIITASCSSKKDAPLLIPPNFAELPDPNKPEQTQQNQDEDIKKLKELLLQ